VSRYTDDYSAADHEEYGYRPEPEPEDDVRDRQRDECAAVQPRTPSGRLAARTYALSNRVFGAELTIKDALKHLDEGRIEAAHKRLREYVKSATR